MGNSDFVKEKELELDFKPHSFITMDKSVMDLFGGNGYFNMSTALQDYAKGHKNSTYDQSKFIHIREAHTPITRTSMY